MGKVKSRVCKLCCGLSEVKTKDKSPVKYYFPVCVSFWIQVKLVHFHPIGMLLGAKPAL